MNDNSNKIIEVDINEILPNRFQPRIKFDETEILELSDSIKEHGVIQPLVVRTIGDKYEIIAGERRYKASVLAGRETVPVVVKNLNDKDSAEIALIENIQRKNLTPIEEALSYKKILDMGYITQEALAIKLGKSQSSVANKIRLLNLSDEIQEALLENKISERHARSLLRLKSITQQNEMLNKILDERLTVRKTDDEIDKILKLKKEEIKEEPKEEKGDENMNNGLNQIPNVITPSTTFDIFGGTQTEIPVTPVIETPVMEPVAMPAVTPVIETPVMEPVAMPAVTPVVETPVVESVPTFGGIQFDSNGNVISVETPVIETPTTSTVTPVVETIVPEIPITSPIIESTPQNTLNTVDLINTDSYIPQVEPVAMPAETPVVETPVTVSESIIPSEPIIVTDYNKQYDPIMPSQEPIQINKVDFKEIINAIRECSSKIEQYGYKIDVEEYDLSTIYQVVFKVEK